MPIDPKDKIVLDQSTVSDSEAQFAGDVETKYVELREQATAPTSPTDKVSCLLYALAADHRLRVKLSTGTIIDLTLAGAGPLTLKGSIAAAAGFPPVEGAVGGVENGWFYYVTADVTDNAGAPAHTNTGQHFLAGSAVAWVHSTLSWLDVSEQVNAQYIAATPTAIGTGDVVAMVNVAGAAVVTLPAAAVGIMGKKISVHDVRGDKAIGTVIAITPDGTDTIDGVNAPVNVDTAFGGYELICVQTGAGPATYGWTTIVGAELKTAIVDRDFAGATLGRMARTGVGTYAIRQDNLAGAVDPVVGDDSTGGYGVDSIWINTTAVPRRIFKCLNAAVGAAVWRQLNARNNLAAAVAPAITDDVALGYDVNSVWLDTTHNNAYVCLNPAAGAAVWRILNTRSQVDSRQLAAATETMRVFRALGPGRIVACAAETGTVAAAAESMTFDVQIAGVTALAGLITIDNTVVIDTPEAGVLAAGAAVEFAAGELITVVRTYVAGGAPTPMRDTVVDIEVQYDL
jgi:hypothetical protein